MFSQFCISEIFLHLLLQLLARDKEDGVRRSAVSGKKVGFFFCQMLIGSKSQISLNVYFALTRFYWSLIKQRKTKWQRPTAVSCSNFWMRVMIDQPQLWHASVEGNSCMFLARFFLEMVYFPFASRSLLLLKTPELQPSYCHTNLYGHLSCICLDKLDFKLSYGMLWYIFLFVMLYCLHLKTVILCKTS